MGAAAVVDRLVGLENTGAGAYSSAFSSILQYSRL
jgi:hypothetical protein